MLKRIFFVLFPFSALAQINIAEFERTFPNDSLYYKAYHLAYDAYKKEKFEKAEELFAYYLKKAPNKEIKEYKEAEARILNCVFAKQAVKNPIKIVLKPISGKINTKLNEYDPCISPDGKELYYTQMVPFKNTFQEDIYVSLKELDGTWSIGFPLSGELNSDYNEGAPFLLADGKGLIFSGCNRPDTFGSCDIYFSYQNDRGDWSEPRNYGQFVNSKYWDAHPSLSPDGSTIYFSSNRPGGKGGKDIWAAKKDGNQWVSMRNIVEINTPYDEVSPFIHADGQTLYFSSSNPEKSIGRLDFFVSRMGDDGKFSEPQNIGYPLNTIEEEYSLKVDINGYSGYFATDKIGQGGLDIVYFELPEHARANKMAHFKGKIVNQYGDIIEKADFKLYVLGEKSNIPTLKYRNGEYFALLQMDKKYGLSATATGYMPFSETIDFNTLSFKDIIEKDIALNFIKINSSIVLKNVYFDTDKSELKPESFDELNQLSDFLKSNPNLKIELQGHTDSSGIEEKNIILSQKRAEALKNYIVKTGVDAARIISKGYGSKIPKQSNDTATGRAANRRTEIKFLSN